MCYAAAGIILLLSNLGRAGYAAAWVLAGAGFLLQVAGFAARITIAGRAPVTNMYESVVWVAFGAILFALVFEAIYRSRYFVLGAVPVAVASLIVADSQTLALDRSINPLVPVLRDNFWLTTHVLTITLSYAAFALALGIGHIALGQVIRGKKTGGRIVQLPIPCLAGWRFASGDRHNPRWRVGQLFVGKILGLGSQGDLGAHHVARLFVRLATRSNRPSHHAYQSLPSVREVGLALFPAAKREPITAQGYDALRWSTGRTAVMVSGKP